MKEVKAFEGIFGNTPYARAILHFMALPTIQHTKGDIAEACNVTRQTIYPVIDKLVEWNIIRPSRKIGNTVLYIWNPTGLSDAIKAMNEEIIQIIIKIELKKGPVPDDKRITDIKVLKEELEKQRPPND